jgi:hypothetical protein
MTTRVTVEATSHDVEIFQVDPRTGDDNAPLTLVPKGESRTVYAHQSNYIEVKEVKDVASG